MKDNAYLNDGEAKSLPARYSFTYVKSDDRWLILPPFLRRALGLAGGRSPVARRAGATTDPRECVDVCGMSVRHGVRPHITRRCKRALHSAPTDFSTTKKDR